MRLRSPCCCSAILVGLLYLAAATTSAFAQGKDEKKKGDDAQRADAQTLVDLVEAAAKGQSSPAGGFELAWGRHYFLKAQGDKTYVPFFVTVPSASVSSQNVGLYLRVTSRAAPAAPPSGTDGKEKEESPYAFEDLYFFDLPPVTAGRPHRLSRAFAVPPGEYDVFVALKERSSKSSAGKSGVVRQAVTVPAFNGDGLSTSDVMIAEKIETLGEPISTETQADHPFTFGQMQIVPALEHRFSKKDELQIVFWIYGAGIEAETNKPSVLIDYKFHRVEGEKQTYFNRTDPQALNAKTLPAQFDLSAGHQLSGSLGVPLGSFPEGEYRLEIDVQDKAAGKQVIRDVRFTVAP